MSDRRRSIGLVLVCAVVAIAESTCSPTSPCDPRATFTFNALEVLCDPAGSDAQCAATAKILSNYTCGTTSADVTSKAVFFSSDPSIAAFALPGSVPGHLTTVGTGNVNVTAQYSDLISVAIRLFVAPGGPAERLLDLTINVRNSTTLARIASASVVVSSDKESPLTCVTDQQGRCGVFVRHGALVIAAVAAGYQAGQTTLTAVSNEYFSGVTLNLSPSGQ